jgi:hypothetical protein
MNTYSERITRPINLLPKGTTLSRYLSALVLNKGLAMSAAEYAQDRWRDTPEVHMIFRSVVEAGDTTTSGWASHLAGTTAGQELMAFLDSASVFNRLASSMHQILFRQPTPIETVPFSVVWISEAGATPVSQMTLATNRVNLELYKQGVLVVFTEELERFSSPGAESRFRNRFVASIAKATDTQ